MIESLGSYKQYGEERRYTYCPICKKEKKDNPCFSLNVKKGKYTCHATGVSGHINQLEGFEDLDIYKVGDSTPEVESDVEVNFTDKYMAMDKDNADWDIYLKSRGITRDTYRQVIHFDKHGKMAIPLSDGKKVVGIKYRTQDKKMSAESGSKYTHLIHWRAITDREYLIITEGEIDLMSSLEAGFKNTVSLPGGATNFKAIKNQVEWLKEFKKIIIATDNDDAGIEAKKEICNILKDSKNLYEVDLGTFKDFNEVLVAEGVKGLKKVIKTVKKIKIKKESEYWGEFIKGDDGYQIHTEKNGYVRLTNFVIELEKYSDNYLEGKVFTEQNTKDFKCSKVELLKKQGMLENLGYFLGSDTKIAKFLLWLEEENRGLYVKEIPHFGIINNQYYDEKSDIVCGKKDLYFKNYSDIEDLTDSDKEWLQNNLLGLRKDVNQSLLGISWALGRYHCENAPYPILEVCGTTSIGKTEFIENVSKLLFGVQENIKNYSTLTNHQIRSLASCSNITPFSIDEVKITSKMALDKVTDLYSLIRSVYDNKTVNQGNTTSKLTEFKLCTPLIISGESELSDNSIKNRMVRIKLTKDNKSTFEVFEIFKNTNILYKLGKEALKNRLNKKIEIDLKGKFLGVSDDRERYNLKCIVQGFAALNEIISIDPEVKKNFFRFLEVVQFVNKMTPEETFKQLLELVVHSGDEYEHFYRREKDIHCARFNMLYKKIREEKDKTNSTLELMDMKAVKKQLVECGFITDPDTVARFDEKDGFTTIKTTRSAVKFKIY